MFSTRRSPAGGGRAPPHDGGSPVSSGSKVAAVQVVLSHYPNSEQDAQVQQVELVAGSRRTLLLTESTRITSTGAKMVSIFGNGANRVLELDWANGLGKVQSAVVPVQVGADGKAVNGQYTAEVDASKAGLAMVTLRRAEDDVAMTAPVLLTVVGGPCAGLALVSATPALDKVEVGMPALLTVKACDEHGNQVPKSAGTLTATVTFGQKSHAVKVQDNTNGAYSLSFAGLPAAGMFKLDCQLKGGKSISLPGRSIAGPTAVDKCVVDSFPTRTVAGQRTLLRVLRHDREGNRLLREEPQVPLQLHVISGPGPVDSFSSELGGGAVELNMSAAKSGKYVLGLIASGKEAGKKVAGTLSLTVLPGPVCVEKSMATVCVNQQSQPMRDPLVAAAGDHISVTIVAKDEFGNDSTLAAGEAFSVVAVGAAENVFTRVGAPLSATTGGKPKAPLTYEATVTTAGVYAVHVNYSHKGGRGDLDLHVAPSEAPTAVKVASRAPSVHGGASTVKPTDATTARRAVGGGTTSGRASAKPPAGSTATPKATSPASSPIEKHSSGGSGSGAGTLAALNVPVAAALAGWPRMLTVAAGRADAKQCALDGSALAGAVCWEPCTLTVHVRDKLGNAKLSGGDELAVVVTKGTKEACVPRVIDHGDGTYAVLFMLTEAGDHSLRATVNGSPVGFVAGKRVQGGSVALHARYGNIQAAHCGVVVPPGPAVCGMEAKLLIQPLQWDEGRRMSGEEAVTVQVIQPSGTRRTLPTTAPPAGGRLMATVAWHEAGVHRVVVLLGGVPVDGVPVDVTVTPGAVEPKLCTLHGKALSGVKCWDENEISLHVKDRFGNLRMHTVDEVEAEVHYEVVETATPSKVQPAGKRTAVPVRAMGGGRYKLQFKLIFEGQVTLHVRVNGAPLHIGGTHFTAQAGELDAAACMVVLPQRPTQCGESARIFVQACLWEDGRVLGREMPVSVQVVAPSGNSMPAEVEYVGAEGRFAATAAMVETGDHKVLARVGGAVVSSGPVMLRAVPGPFHLKLAEIHGDGARRCMAGEKASFSLVARDARGNPLNIGGTPLVLEAKVCIGLPGETRSFGTVHDNGDGTYACEYRLTTCGPMELLLTVQGTATPLVLEGKCVPGRTAASMCTVAEPADEVTADTLGSLTLQRHDEFGNRVDTATRQPPLRATVDGPSAMEVQVHEKGDGSVQVNFRTVRAGVYSLAVADSETGEAVAGSPFALRVLPSTASAADSTWALASGRELNGGESRIVQAGEAVVVKVHVKDEFGNLCPLVGDCRVLLVGPTELALTRKSSDKPKRPAPAGERPSESRPKPTQAESYMLTYSGKLTVSGTYKVKVAFLEDGQENFRPATASIARGGRASVMTSTIANAGVRGGGGTRSSAAGATASKTPREKSAAERKKSEQSAVHGEEVAGPLALVQVVAAAASEQHCTVAGAALAKGVKSWEPFMLTLHTMDAHKNDGTMGGDAVSATLAPTGAAHTGGGPGGRGKCHVDVVDNRDGTYTLNCRVKGDGLWNLQVVVNGKPMPQSFCLQAAGAMLGAADAAVLLPKRPVAGGTTMVYVQAAEYALGRPMSGGENVAMRIVAPSGVCTSVPMTFDAKERRFIGEMAWVEAGEHTASAMIESQLVAGCPLQKLVLPGMVSLAKSTISGDGVARCVAGQRAQFALHAVDSFGNTLRHADAEAAASLELAVLPAAAAAAAGEKGAAAAKRVSGEVEYVGDGVYHCRYLVTTAGSYTQTLTCGQSKEERILPLICVAGPTHPASCTTVDRQIIARRMTAGGMGSLSIQRMDKHGNVIARPGSDKPFVLQVEGPGAMDLTLVELGNGVVEVQYEATLAGSYLLGVHVDGEPVADSPYVVLVDPASVKAPHTTAEFSKNVATAPSGEMDTVEAGAPVHISVAARDRHGNLTPKLKAYQTFVVTADGASEEPVTFTADEKGLTFSAPLTVAGVYSVSVALQDKKQGAESTVGTSVAGDDARSVRTGIMGVAGRQSSGPGHRSHRTSVAGSVIGERRSLLGRGAGSVAGSHTTSTMASRAAARGGGGGGMSRFGGSGLTPGLSADALQALNQSLAAIALPGWPRRIQVLPGRCDVSQCTVTQSDTHVTCWQPTTFMLHTHDQWGNPCAAGGYKVDAKLVAPDGKLRTTAKVTDCMDGTYTITFMLEEAGQWKLAVMVDEQRVPTKLVVDAEISLCKAVDCMALVTGETGDVGVCGGVSTLLVQSVEWESIGRRMNGREKVQVIMRSLQAEGDAEEDTFRTPTKPPRPGGGGRVGMSRTGRAPPPEPTPKDAVKVTADGAGRFSATLQWVHAGPHLVWVSVDGEAIVGSPLTVQVGGGACDPTHCSVTGTAIQGKVRAWEESNVLVTAADRYGTPCIKGGHVVTAELEPASRKLQPLTVDAVDNDDGTYRIPLLIMHEGVWSMMVKVDHVPIFKQPIELNALRAQVYARQCVLSTSGDTKAEGVVGGITAGGPVQAQCGDVQQLRIQPDMWSLGHCMLGCESASLRVETPSGQVLRPPMEFSSGRFVAQCQLLEAGPHAVHGMVDGEPVPGSPMTVEMVAGRINPTLCSVVGLRDISQKVGVPFQVKVVPRDDFGNVSTELDAAAVSIGVEPNAQVLSTTTTTTPEGAVVLTVRAHSVGEFRVSVFLHHLCLSTSIVHVYAGPLSVQHIAVKSEPFWVTAGDASVVVLQARDSEGNNIRVGGEKITGSVGGKPVPVVDCGDGTYHLSVTETRSGPFDLLVSCGAESQTLTGQVLAGPTCVTKCTLVGIEPTVRAGHMQCFQIERRDRFGNLVTRDSSSSCAITRFAAKGVAKGLSPLQVAIQDRAIQKSGDNVDVQYTAFMLGTYTLSVWETSTGTAVPGSPFTVTVQPGLPYAPCCTGVLRHEAKAAPQASKEARGWGRMLSGRAMDGSGGAKKKSTKLQLPAGQKLTVTLRLRDKFGILTDAPPLPPPPTQSPLKSPSAVNGSARSSPVAAASPVKSLTSKSTSAPTSPAKGQASPGHIVDVKTVADEGVSLKGVELEGLDDSNSSGVAAGAAAADEGPEVITVVARNSDTGAEVVMQRTGTHVVGSHSAEYEAALDAMGTWRLHMVAGGDRALLNTGDHSGIHVVPGHAVAGDFVELSTVQFMAYRTVDVRAMCSDKFGNTGATGKAVVSVDHFLTMSSWLGSPDAKKRFELSDPLVTGSPLRIAQVQLPAAGRWKILLEAPIDGEFTMEGLPKFKVLAEHEVDILDDPSLV